MAAGAGQSVRPLRLWTIIRGTPCKCSVPTATSRGDQDNPWSKDIRSSRLDDRERATRTTPDGLTMTAADLAALAAMLFLPGLVILGNWCCLIVSLFAGKRVSSIPFIGGCGVSAVLLFSEFVASRFPVVHAFWWLPLLIDWGCAPGLIYGLVMWLLAVGRRKRSEAA